MKENFIIHFAVFMSVASIIQGYQLPELEKDLLADPTKCKTTDTEYRFKLDDIARPSNESIALTVFGRLLYSHIVWPPSKILISFVNIHNSKRYDLYIYDDNAVVESVRLPEMPGRLRDPQAIERLNETTYHENTIDLFDLFQVDIEFEFGDELRINALLSNGAKISVVEATTDIIGFVNFDNRRSQWYFNCPPPGKHAITVFTKSNALNLECFLMQSKGKLLMAIIFLYIITYT